MRFLRLLLVSICSLVYCCHVTQAQDLALTDTITGALSAGSSETFDFTAREGQMLSFIATAEDDLDPVLSITDLNNNIIIRNDDYNYPDSRDAIIEGFIAPYTGSYSLTLEAYGQSSGDYTLAMFAGYSTVSAESEFDDEGGWAVIGVGLINEPTMNIVNGTANIIQEGIDQAAFAIGMMPESDVYYARTTVDSISNNDGWRVGLVFAYQDEQNYARVLVNYRGAWRITSVQSGVETVLRDWNIHPAIMPGTESFTLGILVNGNSVDVFYDEQFIGRSDADLTTGQVGLAVETVSSVGSTVTARFDDFLMTEPTLVNDVAIFPTHLVANGMNPTVRELERRLLIPTGGEMAFTLSESFAQNNREGISRFAIGNGRTATNFAIGTQVRWTTSNTALAGCGLVVRDNDAEDYVLAYIDNMDGYGLSERSGDSFIQNTFNSRIDLQQVPYEMVLIVRDEHIHYYLNGEHAASIEAPIRDGSIAEAVVNFEAANTNCQFNNTWVWQW